MPGIGVVFFLSLSLASLLRPVRVPNPRAALSCPAIETLNESELEGRFIIVREDREEQKFRNAKACKVTGLPGDVTWQRVKDNFRNAGDVRARGRGRNKAARGALVSTSRLTYATLFSRFVLGPPPQILHVDVFPAEDGTSNATVRFADEMSANNGTPRAQPRVACVAAACLPA